MLDVNFVRNNLEQVISNVANKKVIFDKILFNELESQKKKLQIQMEELQAKRNSISKQIGVLKQNKQNADDLFAQMEIIGANLTKLEVEYNSSQDKLTQFMYQLPNLIDSSVPIGNSELDNKLIRKYSKPREFSFVVKDHVELGLKLNKQLDFETASKMSGSRFVILKNKVAKLHRALAQFMLDTHINEHGYNEVYVPYMVNSEAVLGTGQLPKFADDLFKLQFKDNDYYLIPTAEVPLTNMVKDSIVPIEQLPLKFVAHSPCFRSEAGSYGKDTKGMIRMHQFDKVEMVQIVSADSSYQVLEEMVIHAENILQKLQLPYQVITLCSGDMGFSAAKTYDLEVWLPSQNTYREISSISNMTDYQTRRLQARYKGSNGKNQLLHSLNGSGLAVGRTLVAVLENYQNEDGSITIPEVLIPYMNCKIITIE
jgi:seryl-tRNA synthetase